MHGYGIFWSIIEHLRNDSDHKLNLSDCNAIAFTSHCETKDVEKVVKDFGLFDIDKQGSFYSPSLIRRMEEMEKRRAVLSEAGRRGGLASSQAKARLKQASSSKGKESKVNKVNKRSDSDFLETLKTNTAYRHLSIDSELSKMDAWLAAHPGRKKSRKFVVNWLNRIEAPLETKSNDQYANLPKQVL